MKVYHVFILLLFIGCTSNSSSSDINEVRDPWLWPFSAESIWNMPIGSNAEYKPANFEDASHVGVDIQHILITSENDPEQPVLNSPTWGPGRCSGTTSLGFSVRVPDTWIVPDAGNSPYGLTPNSNFAFLLPDRETVFQSSTVSRCKVGGPVYMPEWMKWENNRKFVSIKSDGLHGGGQGASGMSALGGTIRLGELVDDQPIRHAIKINPWAEKYLHYSEEIPGWKWPAFSADTYAPHTYNRNADSDIVMGSLFAIPPEISKEDVGITTQAASKLFFAMQNYGVYFTEDAAYDVWDIIVERNVEIEFENEFGFSMTSDLWRSEINKLMKALHIITNNNPDTIGGGGTLLQPLAPDFER